MQLMKQAGLEVRIDEAGNIIGTRKGKNPSLPVLAFGSHIDSVPGGGNYDGDVGVLGALECIELLNENKIITDHPLEMIIFSDEEGGLTGSHGMLGTLKQFDLDRISSSGKSVRDGIKFIGGNPDALLNAKRKPGSLKAFLELHIEQGGILDEKKINIGVVEGIVGIKGWEVTITGKANHAGTTAMDNRQDAMLAAAKLTIAVNEIARSIPGKQVGTVGKIKAEPGAPNVIPGRVTMSIEKIKAASEEIQKETNTKIEFKTNNDHHPALTDKAVQDQIAKQADKLGLSNQYMPSGAGHDSQNMAVLAPTGMIFIPSKDGISHSPREYSDPQDMANGASVLFHTILAIDKKK
jgi:N-carbamoyl-L-amino-acid hydrolase